MLYMQSVSRGTFLFVYKNYYLLLLQMILIKLFIYVIIIQITYRLPFRR